MARVTYSRRACVTDGLAVTVTVRRDGVVLLRISTREALAMCGQATAELKRRSVGKWVRARRHNGWWYPA